MELRGYRAVLSRLVGDYIYLWKRLARGYKSDHKDGMQLVIEGNYLWKVAQGKPYAVDTKREAVPRPWGDVLWVLAHKGGAVRVRLRRKLRNNVNQVQDFERNPLGRAGDEVHGEIEQGRVGKKTVIRGA